MTKLSKVVLLIVISMISLISLRAYLDIKFDEDFTIGVAAIGSGILTFGLCIIISEESGSNWISEPGHIRATIALSIIVEYMVVVGFTIFFNNPTSHVSELAKSFITNFTSIVGIVIAFFFGSSAYLQAQEQKGRLPQKPAEKPAEDPLKKS